MKAQILEFLHGLATEAAQKNGRKLGLDITEEVRAELESDVDPAEEDNGVMSVLVTVELDDGREAIAAYFCEQLYGAWKLE